MRLRCILLLCFSMPGISWQVLDAQQTPVLSSELGSLEGTDPDDHVVYTRIFLAGTLVPPAQTADRGTLPPTLTAQCTKHPDGKLGFELFANFGGVEDHGYHRPWMPKDGGFFPPPPGKAIVTMEFLGYTRVKPVKRQWDLVEHPAGEMRYSSPAMGSANMEDVSFYLQYLKALPTLRLTYGGRAAQFVTTPLLERLHGEPLCRASRL